VAWAAPLYIGGAQAKLLSGDGTYQVTLAGLDADTLAGAPAKLIAGNVLDLRLPQSVVVDMGFVERIQEERGEELELGGVFEMNDRRAVIVGIARSSEGQGGASFVFTTWDRAKEYAPGQRKMLTHILAAPDPGRSEAEVTRAITRETGLKAVTEAQLREMSVNGMVANSPLPYFVGLLVGIGFVIGLGISGQTFYAFVLENTRHLGALKAMGASNLGLAQMIVVQAAVVGFVGFGVGVGVMSGLLSMLPEGRAPLVMLWQIPLIVFVAVTLICTVTALACVWRVSRIEPGIVFRA
jgi:putative ABC transport system permease protein